LGSKQESLDKTGSLSKIQNSATEEDKVATVGSISTAKVASCTNIEAKIIFQKSVSNSSDGSDVLATHTPLNKRIESSISLFANRSQSQFTTLPQLFRANP